MAFDLAALLADPNFQQQLGNTGQAISNDQPIGQALNPAPMINQVQTQTATAELLKKLLAGVNNQTGAAQPQQTQTEGVPTQNVQPWQPPKPTPVGQAGPDSVATKTTADGTTHTVSEPSAQNLNSFGSSVPAESLSLANNKGSSVPFLQALLQQ